MRGVAKGRYMPTTALSPGGPAAALYALVVANLLSARMGHGGDICSARALTQISSLNRSKRSPLGQARSLGHRPPLRRCTQKISAGTGSRRYHGNSLALLKPNICPVRRRGKGVKRYIECLRRLQYDVQAVGTSSPAPGGTGLAQSQPAPLTGTAQNPTPSGNDAAAAFTADRARNYDRRILRERSRSSTVPQRTGT